MKPRTECQLGPRRRIRPKIGDQIVEILRDAESGVPVACACLAQPTLEGACVREALED
jgi:hypothetical protein